MLQAARHLPEATIRDAVDSVFRAAEYNRFSLFSKLLAWLGHLWTALREILSPLFARVTSSPPVYWGLIAILALLVIAAIARTVLLWRARRGLVAAGMAWELTPFRRGRGDPWSQAQALAARGEFTDAAHLLYAALLESAARQQQLRLHPSKTIGDYVRELRTRSSALFGRFREFARSYETVIYGIGTCDRERFERLQSLARPIVESRG